MINFVLIKHMLKLLFQPLVKFRFLLIIQIVLTFFISIGKKVLIVNGAYRGQEATLEDIHQDAFSVDVTLLTVRLEFDCVSFMEIL